jgi:hypothetical protein
LEKPKSPGKATWHMQNRRDRAQEAGAVRTTAEAGRRPLPHRRRFPPR